jgi:hypothetical protein
VADSSASFEVHSDQLVEPTAKRAKVLEESILTPSDQRPQEDFKESAVTNQTNAESNLPVDSETLSGNENFIGTPKSKFVQSRVRMQ